MTPADAETGSKLGGQAIFVSDIVDRANVPDAKMTVGFARVGNREPLDISFPYDSVVASVSQVERQTTEMDDQQAGVEWLSRRSLLAKAGAINAAGGLRIVRRGGENGVGGRLTPAIIRPPRAPTT